MTWRDVTSYSRGDTVREPRSWEIVLGPERIVVTRHVQFDVDDWCMAWRGDPPRVISRGSLAEAQEIAIGLVEAHAERTIAAVRNLRGGGR